MEENQNNEQPQELADAEIKESSENTASEVTTAIPQVKEETTLQPQTTKPQTAEMEVHKHPHHVMHKKKWNEYLLEFFMLFLAVFLGFLAENLREHEAEHEREQNYMQSMIADLKSDSLMLKNNIGLRKRRIEMIDSMIAILSSPDRTKKGDDIYFFGRSISPPTNIFPNDGTIQQLKSSGNLRLIHKATIANSIMAYDQTMRNALFEMEDESRIRAEYRQLASKLFRTPVFNEMISTDTVSRPTNNPQLYTNDTALLNEFIGGAQYYKRVHQAQLIRSEELLLKAQKLIKEIKQEYHFDDE